MTFPSRTLVSLVLGVLTPLSLLADGMNIKNGRFASGPVIELRLSPSQSKLVQRQYKAWMTIELNVEQQAFLKLKGKLDEPPTKVKVLRTADAVGECTCGSANFGLIYKSGWIELPSNYLCSDKQAEEGLIKD